MSMLIPAAYGAVATPVASTINPPLRLVYTAFSANGTQSTLISTQQPISPWQYLMVGDGSIDMTTAIAQNICKNPNGNPITASTETQRLNLATGMVTYFTNIPAPADGVYCIAFAVGGLSFTTVQDVELVIRRADSTSAQNPADILFNISNPVPIGGFGLIQPGNYAQIYLNGSNQLLKQDGTTTVVYGTDTIVMCPAYGVVFGAIKVTDVTDAPAAGDSMALNIYLY